MKNLNYYTFEKTDETPFYILIEVIGKPTKVWVTKEFYDLYEDEKIKENKRENYSRRCIVQSETGNFRHCSNNKCTVENCPLNYSEDQLTKMMTGKELSLDDIYTDHNEELEDKDSSIVDRINEQEERAVLYKEIAAIKDPVLKVIIEEYINFSTEKEIAKKVCISQQAVHKRINSFINYLKEKYQKK